MTEVAVIPIANEVRDWMLLDGWRPCPGCGLLASPSDQQRRMPCVRCSRRQDPPNASA